MSLKAALLVERRPDGTALLETHMDPCLLLEPREELRGVAGEPGEGFGGFEGRDEPRCEKK